MYRIQLRHTWRMTREQTVWERGWRRVFLRWRVGITSCTQTQRENVLVSFACLRYARTTKTLQEEAGTYPILKNVDPSTTNPSSTCTDTKKEKSQLNEPNTVDTYLRYTRILITNRILRVCVIKMYHVWRHRRRTLQPFKRQKVLPCEYLLSESLILYSYRPQVR